LPRERANPPEDLVVGYCTPLIARPGERVGVHASTPAHEYGVEIVRFRGLEAEPVTWAGEPRTFAGRDQPLDAGSCVVVGPSPALAVADGVRVRVQIFPTLLTEREQVVLGTLDESGQRGWQVVLNAQSGIGLRLADVGTFYVWPVPAIGEWVEVEASCIDGDVRVRCGEDATRGGPVEAWAGNDVLVVGAPHVRRAGVRAEGNGCFNGKIADPVVLDGGTEVCRLDFARAIGRARFESEQGHAAHVVNAPASGVTGPAWRGATAAFHEAPDQYAALHFHDDDLEDAGWEPDATVELPADLEPGVYAARLTTPGCTDDVPFIVTTPTAASTAKVAVLLPTLTYLAYGSETEILDNPFSYRSFTGRDASEAPLGWRDHLAKELGLVSLYDMHRDGSSPVYASARRPLLNMRGDYTWPLLEGPHGLPVDLALMAWLGDRDIAFDLLTDHDLHAHGQAALDPYAVVLTGGHPEYWTAAMLDAAHEYCDGGGRLLYLGGNGFFWVTGVDPERPHVMEVRRGLAGSRPSTSPPGETWLSSTNEQGGLWRFRGRAPQRLVGVGTAALGGVTGRPYRRTEASHDPRFAFAFEGVDGDLIGTTGSILGAAAGYEIDRTDPALGTPRNAVVLATSTPFDELYFPVIEDFTGTAPELADPTAPEVRADLVLTPKPNGGATFAAGSAAWLGSVTGGDHGASTVTENVLRRFAETPRGVSPLAPDGP
jgi:N,N-dimethylformamidase